MKSSCQLCLHDDTHPFGLTFIDGVCGGCFTHREKDNIDWHKKYTLLVDFAKKLKSKRSSSSVYDCIVPVRGVAEDYFVVEQVLKLDLHPLLVSINDYFYNDIGWHNLHNLITVFDLDSQLYSPNISEYRELVSTSFRKNLHILYPSLSLNASYPVHVAIERNIPSIIWGQLQLIEQVGMFSHHDRVQMTKWSQLEHDRLGSDIDDLIGNGAQINPKNLSYYDFPKRVIRSGLNAPMGIFLSNYLRWDPLKQNHSILKYGFKPQSEIATFDPYERAGSSVYYTVHEISRLLRHGYPKVRDHINREIRHQRLSKSTGIKLYEFYKNRRVYIEPFFKWLQVSESGKEWILKHLFSQYRHHISDVDETEYASALPDLPSTLKKLIPTSSLSQYSFIPYGKGI